MIKKLNRHLQERGIAGTIKRFKKCTEENGMRYTIKQIFAPPINIDQVYVSPSPVIKQTEKESSLSYITNTEAQSNYLKNYKSNQTKHRCKSLLSLLKAEKNNKGVILYPVSYDINVKQRPEHILRVLSEEGYLCIMLKIGADHQSVSLQKLGEKLYFTDLYEEAISYFSDKPVYLYTTTPFFYYLSKHLKKALFIYDVLDDLKIFANYCKPMEIDHRELLKKASIVIYSSEVMREKIEKITNCSLLLENGVWLNDFKTYSDYIPKHIENDLPQLNRTKIGYHGVISELLNFDILESILEKSNADVYLIGPVVAFDPTKDIELKNRIRDLKQYRNLHLLGFIPYKDLVYYLKQFDYSIIPFIITEATDAVSPLKLFESLACGKPVLATATKTLNAYKKIINILNPEDFADFILQRNGLKIDEKKYDQIVQKNSWKNLVNPLIIHLHKKNTINNSDSARLVKSRNKTVDILNINFFDWNGEVLYKGGAERYVYDLAKLCIDSGFTTRIMQNANFYFKKELDGIEIIGVPSKFEHQIPKLSDYYNSFCSQTDLLITSPLDLACELNPEQNIIGINHGIWWDDKFNSINKYDFNRYKGIFDGLKSSDTCVCVDTNFINWVRTYDWELAQKCTYIPNYVDLDQFQPFQKNFDEELVILYPRRLYEARGLYITMDAFDYLFNKYPWLKLHLVGQADEQDTFETNKFISKYPNRIEWYELDMKEMHLAYKKSHIVLVPTMYAEGTSLSCIEAMATNNAVIATTIGGLPNLISHNYNGLLIQPTVVSIIKSVEKLIIDRDTLKQLAKNALHTSTALNKKNWLRSWEEVIGQTTGSEIISNPEKKQTFKLQKNFA